MKRIAVTVTLNRSSLQIDEPAHARLEAYLAEAARTLDGHPDRDEILADLEQAVADQCLPRLASRESIVTLAILDPALEEIGPLQIPELDAPSTGAAGRPAGPAAGDARPLQQVSEGAWVAGVCKGLARYLGLDVTLVRVLALLLLLVTGGGAVLVYAGLMLLLPYAPPEPGSPPIGRLPARCREFVLYLRGKLGALAS
jgi:phage shock protein PspC (stress-responsive transcriptional regulator)